MSSLDKKKTAHEDKKRKETILTGKILSKPDQYFGSFERKDEDMWIYESGSMLYKHMSYIPAFIQYFDKVLLKVIDNQQLEVDIDVLGETIRFKVSPQLISSKDFTIDMTNLFSKEFVIETADGSVKTKQAFSDNKRITCEPILVKCKASDKWTEMKFKPDLARFNMTCFEEDIVGLVKRRVVDIAGCMRKIVDVKLDGQKINIKSFSEYVNLYSQLPTSSLTLNNGWEFCVIPSDGQFRQVSFVNGIPTMKGGTHVDYLTDLVVTHVLKVVNKAAGNLKLADQIVKNYFWVFVNSCITDPLIEDERLRTRARKFGECQLSQNFLERVENSEVVQSILSLAHLKESKDLTGSSTKRKRIINIPKLEDATGDELNPKDRTLILTEGDSAKALAVAGLSVIGRENYGVFPLRGKPLNARGATDRIISNNQVIKDVMEIFGLVPGKEYKSVDPLNYGHLMMMMDQDDDGFHMKGLIINMLHVLWPSLLSVPSFLSEFRTPIVKATRKNPAEVLLFYSMEDFRRFKGQSKDGWRIKHYKGLGSITSKEAKEYFKDPHKSIRKYHCLIDEDAAALDVAFNKTKADERKVWVDNYMVQKSINEEDENGVMMQISDFLDWGVEGKLSKEYNNELEDDLEDGMTSVSHFVNTQLVQFSAANLQRNIPSVIDGLKPVQRKILFTALSHDIYEPMIVSHFSGCVANCTCYHHGEDSLNQAIIGMSRDYVGSNNIPLLQADGQFGTRRGGGEDKAKARYPRTCLSGITRYVFPFGDDICLEYKNENGRFIEPTWYTPVIPIILVNGCTGVGTGYSTSVPNYLPTDVIGNVRRLLRDKPLVPMIPRCVRYGGSIEEGTEPGTFINKGIIKVIDCKTLEICELPIRVWTEDYCEKVLQRMMDDKSEIVIQEYKNISTDDDMVKLKIILRDELSKEQEPELLEKFNLITTFSITNMNLFDVCGRIKEYKSPEEILQDHYNVRLKACAVRLELRIKSFENDLKKLENKIRFIEMADNGDIKVFRRKEADLIAELGQKNFDADFPKQTRQGRVLDEDKWMRGSGYEQPFGYLLSADLKGVTDEEFNELCDMKRKIESELGRLKDLRPKSLWLEELDKLEWALNQSLESLHEEAAKEALMRKKYKRMVGFQELDEDNVFF